MGYTLALDEDVTVVYKRLVRRESEDAATIIEQIHDQFGTHIALRAALIILLLKEEMLHYQAIPEVDMYSYLLKDFPEAVPFVSEAITRCLESWGFHQNDKSGWEKWQRTLRTQTDGLRVSFEDLLQRIRQYSPITAIKLEQIYDTYGVRAGFYGATALIWLKARIDKKGYKSILELTSDETQEFTFFQHMRHDEEATGHFIEMLDCFRGEQRPVTVGALPATRVPAGWARRRFTVKYRNSIYGHYDTKEKAYDVIKNELCDGKTPLLTRKSSRGDEDYDGWSGLISLISDRTR